MNKVELFNDHFQNFKVYGIPKAQLIIADPPYNLGKNAYASNPSWYVDGDNKNGESGQSRKGVFRHRQGFSPGGIYALLFANACERAKGIRESTLHDCVL